jgi:hypothetical protein
MSYNRAKFKKKNNQPKTKRFYDDEEEMFGNARAIQERQAHLRDKRIQNALRTKDISALYEEDEDELEIKI